MVGCGLLVKFFLIVVLVVLLFIVVFMVWYYKFNVNLFVLVEYGLYFGVVGGVCVVGCLLWVVVLVVLFGCCCYCEVVW